MTLGYTPNYAAPELFGKCSKCNTPGCDRFHGKLQIGKKTTETDIYAFGCLYYAVSLSAYPSVRITRLVQIFFEYVPYAGKHPFQISHLVTSAKHPPRLESPNMEDKVWDLIEKCWEWEPSNRPKMQDIVETITSFIQGSFSQRSERSTVPHVAETSLLSFPQNHPSSTSVLPTTLPPSPATSEPSLPETFRSVLATLRELAYPLLRRQWAAADNNQSVTLGRSTGNKATVDLICELLNLPEHDVFTASELLITSDVELLLDVLLDV